MISTTPPVVIATIRFMVDELERCRIRDPLVLPHLEAQLADEFELLARALRTPATTRQEHCPSIPSAWVRI
ncbi:hypothetical protein AKJ09_00493 [Labilithrix luteola]|uniref:Uncharacterized protein n=1 Tax=Labilithrix luteola TaxID=1391654 RepID=A0A0K1PL33_9BACT|nr:hypothetical protein [Labilithrix luteola]AKU93829.1 hypothetical protein AKJ09_00493 [Labilithrix luteola]